ncbi:MAG: PE-PPE domain-containing protein [Polyangiaceae bacterium]|nr:PE-PPE domain-containing protein [Polyangiaceae bacterium]
MPQNPPAQDLFSTLSDLLEQVVPLLGAAVVLAQVTGQILKATNPDTGPPPTYYIGMDPNDPSAAAQPQLPPGGTAITPVVGIGIDHAGGLFIEGPNHQVLLGATGQPVAVVGVSMVNGSPVLTGNNTILIGLDQLPLAGQGSATGLGPVVDNSPDGVHMQVSPMMGGIPGKHTLYNVCGTGGTWDNDFTATIAAAVNGGNWYWQGVSYPAQTFPMGPSVKAGVEELVRLISETPGTFAIMGYSQGAIVTCKVWRDEIMNPAGRLHDRINDIFAHVSFGNPLRCPGYANGNPLAGLPPVADQFGYQTGGIAGPDDLTPWQTMWWHMDFAHQGDLYVSCPTGPDPWANEAPPGEMETAIYKLVQGEITGDESILQQVGEILTDPFNEMVPTIMALIDGIQFLADMGSHGYDDCRDAAINYLKDRGNQVPVGS